MSLSKDEVIKRMHAGREKVDPKDRKPRRNPIEKSNEKPKSLRAAIDAKCYDCIYDPQAGGSWRDQVSNCTCIKCPLHKVRWVQVL